jgi:hypothetical protein
MKRKFNRRTFLIGLTSAALNGVSTQFSDDPTIIAAVGTVTALLNLFLQAPQKPKEKPTLQ